ncbi:MAG: type II secretion system protein [Huintestinicola sp.]
MKNTRFKGFTLIELIVVIAIVGVLAAILVPTMIGYVKDSKYSTANTNAKLAYSTSMNWFTQCDNTGNNPSQRLAVTIPLGNIAGSLGYQGNVYEDIAFDGTVNDLTTNLIVYMGNGAGVRSGTVYIDMDPKNGVTFAQWSATQDHTIIGNYPVENSASKDKSSPLVWGRSR